MLAEESFKLPNKLATVINFIYIYHQLNLLKNLKIDLGRMWTVAVLAATCPFGQNIVGVEELKAIKESIMQLDNTTTFQHFILYTDALNDIDWNESRLVDIFNGMYVLKLIFFYENSVNYPIFLQI